MESNMIHRIHELFHHFFYSSETEIPIPKIKKCPVTGLNISMQPPNSRFLSYTGVKWYYENDRKTYEKKLAVYLTESCKKKELSQQFKSISHAIRNKESNPRNNTKRAINKLLSENGCLFDNYKLIDQNKLKEAKITK